MNRQVTMFFMVVASLFAAIYAECPNACSAHGKCGAYDMCTCYRNWMSSDCSESTVFLPLLLPDANIRE